MLGHYLKRRFKFDGALSLKFEHNILLDVTVNIIDLLVFYYWDKLFKTFE